MPVIDTLSNIAKNVNAVEYSYEYSICTLVTKLEEYHEMLQSFLDNGFDKETCEYIFIDNTVNSGIDAYKGLNIFLQKANGRYIIICHQDILISEHNRNDLTKRITEIENADNNWAILGNAGGVNFKWIATNITQGSGRKILEPRLPLLTQTVDENFMVIKNSANLALSNNLKGFHMYGPDISLIADILGFNSYVIDFLIIHKSNGNAGEDFIRSKKQFLNKYNKALRGRFMSTTITKYYIGGNRLRALLFNFQPIKFFVRQFFKAFLRKGRYVLKVIKL